MTKPHLTAIEHPGAMQARLNGETAQAFCFPLILSLSQSSSMCSLNHGSIGFDIGSEFSHPLHPKQRVTF